MDSRCQPFEARTGYQDRRVPTVQRRARLVGPAYGLARVLADAGRPTRDGVMRDERRQAR